MKAMRGQLRHRPLARQNTSNRSSWHPVTDSRRTKTMSESSWWHDPRAKRKRLRQEMARQRPSGTPKSMWARYQKWLAGELEEEVRQVAEREAERRTDAARPKERSNPQPSREPRPDNRPPPGLSLEERR